MSTPPADVTLGTTPDDAPASGRTPAPTTPVFPPSPVPPRQSEAAGVFSRQRVRLVAFGIISICLFAVAFLCVLAVWDYIGQDSAWKSLATLGIVVVTMASFTVLNEMFGSSAAREGPTPSRPRL